MVYKAELKKQAEDFRKRGFTYSEIAKICNVSKATVSNWLANKSFSKQVRKDNEQRARRDNIKRLGLMNKAKMAERRKRYEAAVASATVEYQHFKRDPQFMAGLCVYSCLGERSNTSQIRISSKKQAPHRLFRAFARDYLGVTHETTHFWLLLRAGQNEAACVTHWSENLALSDEQWYKNQVVPSKAKADPLHFGVGNTIIVSTVLKYKLMHWLELAEKDW